MSESKNRGQIDIAKAARNLAEAYGLVVSAGP
jgi:hypothetical protein